MFTISISFSLHFFWKHQFRSELNHTHYSSRIFFWLLYCPHPPAPLSPRKTSKRGCRLSQMAMVASDGSSTGLAHTLESFLKILMWYIQLYTYVTKNGAGQQISAVCLCHKSRDGISPSPPSLFNTPWPPGTA